MQLQCLLDWGEWVFVQASFLECDVVFSSAFECDNFIKKRSRIEVLIILERVMGSGECSMELCGRMSDEGE